MCKEDWSEPVMVVKKDGQLMITYAAAVADATYTVRLLKPVMGSDILNPDNWRKSNYPLMSSNSVPGQYGTGHNSYLIDENGLVWNFYHMRSGVDGPRSSAARRTHFDIDGEPMLDITYPQLYARTFYEGQRETGMEKVVNLLRCAWAGSQRYGALVWSGDIHSDWETFCRHR